MTARQRVVLCVALGLIALFSLFPPWLVRSTIDQVYYSKGYGLVFAPPRAARLDFSRLLAQYIIVGAAVGFVFVRRDAPAT